MRHFVFQLTFTLVAVVLISSCDAQDTDGDGLLDLIDVPGFDPNGTGIGNYINLGIQDLDGANMLIHLSYLFLTANQIASIDSQAFGDLANLETLDLSRNQISSRCNAPHATVQNRNCGVHHERFATH